MKAFETFQWSFKSFIKILWEQEALLCYLSGVPQGENKRPWECLRHKCLHGTQQAKPIWEYWHHLGTPTQILMRKKALKDSSCRDHFPMEGKSLEFHASVDRKIAFLGDAFWIREIDTRVTGTVLVQIVLDTGEWPRWPSRGLVPNLRFCK